MRNFQQNTVVADWYSRIQSVQSKGVATATQKDCVQLREEQLALLDYDALFFELERFKRERTWHNLNITKDGIRDLLADPSWYTLYLPSARLAPSDFVGVFLLQQVAAELLRRYCDRYYNYRKRSWIEPRLELRELAADDDIFPPRDKRGEYEPYQLIVDGDEHQLILSIQKIKKEIEENKEYLRKLSEPGDLKACKWGVHLYQPLFHVRPGGKITVLPVALNESEYQFVEELKTWCRAHKKQLAQEGTELFLLRNMSRGRGVGFFEAGNFHPDFILWKLSGQKQYITFIEPHGLHHEGPGSDKILFHARIKDVEKRLGDPAVVLNSFILSWTPSYLLKWGISKEEMETMHVLFMKEDRDHYLDKLFVMLAA